MFIGSNEPLPPPVEFAKELRTEALRFVNKAHQNFGVYYKQLDLAHRFLLRVHRVDFTRVQAVSRAERLAEENRQRRIATRHAESLASIQQELAEHRVDIDSACAQLANGASLLVPDVAALVSETNPPASSMNEAARAAAQQRLSDPTAALAALDNLDQNPASSRPTNGTSPPLRRHDVEDDHGMDGRDSTSDASARALGLPAHELELTISIRKDHRVSVAESSDNTELIRTVREQIRIVNTKHIPMCKRWISTLQGCTAPGAEALLIELLSLLERLKSARHSCEKLEIITSPTRTTTVYEGLGQPSRRTSGQPSNCTSGSASHDLSNVRGICASDESVGSADNDDSSDEDEELEDVPGCVCFGFTWVKVFFTDGRFIFDYMGACRLAVSPPCAMFSFQHYYRRHV